MEDVENRKIVTLIQEEHFWADGGKPTFYTLLEMVRGQLPASASSLPWELLGG
jgi:hypothetical protein